MKLSDLPSDIQINHDLKENVSKFQGQKSLSKTSHYWLLIASKLIMIMIIIIIIIIIIITITIIMTFIIIITINNNTNNNNDKNVYIKLFLFSSIVL